MGVNFFFRIKKHSHSRESGNLPESLTVFWHRAPKQSEDREIPAFAGMGIILIDAAPVFHSGESRNLCGEAAFADRRPLQCSASRKILANARMRFRLSPEWKFFFSGGKVEMGCFADGGVGI